MCYPMDWPLAAGAGAVGSFRPALCHCTLAAGGVRGVHGAHVTGWGVIREGEWSGISATPDSHVMSCHGMSCHVMSCLMTCRVMSCRARSCHVVSVRSSVFVPLLFCYISIMVTDRQVMSGHGMSCHVMWCLLTCRVMSCHVMSCLAWSCHVLS